MIQPPPIVLKLPIQTRAEMALKAAVAKVIARHIREGTPISIWRDGKVVEVSAQELRESKAVSSSKTTLYEEGI